MDNPNVLYEHHSSSVLTAELIAAEIADVISSARHQGQSLDDLRTLVLEDDPELDGSTRQWLSEIVAEAWADLLGSESVEVERNYAAF
jgi:hypothetical protein